MTRVASPSEFPSWPAAWYIVARSRDVPRGGVIARNLGGAEIVVFRTASGRLATTTAHCPHMGTNLRHGRVHGDAIVCPMHHWTIDARGAVSTAAGSHCGQAETWSVEERCGLVLVWLGSEAGHSQSQSPPGPLPIPADADTYRWRAGGPMVVDTPWHALMVSAYDMDHLSSVHYRRLVEGPIIETLGDGRLRLSYVSKVTGGGLVDRIMGRLGRDGIAVTMTCGGPNFVVETTMGSRRTSAILGLLPLATSAGPAVHAYGSFGVTRDRWLASAQTRIASWLFLGFLRKDFAIIEGIRLRTQVTDAGVRAMCNFLASLPEAARD